MDRIKKRNFVRAVGLALIAGQMADTVVGSMAMFLGLYLLCVVGE